MNNKRFSAANFPLMTNFFLWANLSNFCTYLFYWFVCLQAHISNDLTLKFTVNAMPGYKTFENRQLIFVQKTSTNVYRRQSSFFVVPSEDLRKNDVYDKAFVRNALDSREVTY